MAIVRPSAPAGENAFAGAALPTTPVKIVPSFTDVAQQRPRLRRLLRQPAATRPAS